MRFNNLIRALLLEIFVQDVLAAGIRSIFLFKDVMVSDTTSIKTSGFNSLIMFGVGILDNGDIMYYSNTAGSSDVLVASNGTYVGGSALSDKVQSFKTGTTSVDRVEICMNSAHVAELVASPGTGPETPLYQNFAALKTAWNLDAVNNDDESIYDVTSTVKFAQMLGNIGYKYAITPYTNTSFWTSLKQQLSDLLDRTYLQCYDGGAGNDPGSWQTSLGMKVVPIVWVVNDSKPSYGTTPAQAMTKFSTWNQNSDVAGGGYWNDYDIEKMESSYTDYGSALTSFKQEQEKLAQQAKQKLDRKVKSQGAPAVEAKDWVENTPAGQRKILKPLDDDHHKAYLPKVVESPWYSFWEKQALFQPQTEKDGSVKTRGKYVIAMPPPNKPAIAVVETGELVIRPDVQKRSYLQWMQNLQDWCLSRQLWWGHQIPAYFVSVEGEDAGGNADDKYWDVLDTWFSAGLWPFSTLGWPDKTEDLEKYFPNTTLKTGWDITPFWKKAFPQGIPDIGADALRFSLVNYTQSSGSDINFDIKTMHGYRKLCNKIYQATKYVLGRLGNDFVPRESGALTGKESLSERWILTKMNAAAQQINQALEEREFAKSTQISYRFLYDELFDIYIENSKSIISDGTLEEARSAMDTLYTTLESGLRLVSPFMPFLTEELWQRLPRRPGDDTFSISIAEYPEFEESFHDPQISYDTVSAQLSAIKALSGKTPVNIGILPVQSVSPAGCAVFPVSAEANVYLEVNDRMQDAGNEVEKLKAKLAETRKSQEDSSVLKADLSKLQDVDVTEARQSAERRKLDLEARSRALMEAIAMFEKMTV
ncbi:putative valine--tRNA ligase [Seiridium unicorne]|uniref:valine--tRNA ligase n=1 Tax=Seiridium unicorne TaxID=138068 RepID=A0ABR2UMY0_9PEZI